MTDSELHLAQAIAASARRRGVILIHKGITIVRPAPQSRPKRFKNAPRV
jgi:hypothetical protein